MRALLSVLCLLPLAACGYHVSGKADLIPKRIQTIAIPAFGNATTKYKLSENLTRSIAREFISRTRYRIVADPNQAEAILTGHQLQSKAHNRWRLPHVCQVAHRLSSCTQGESQGVGNMPVRRWDT